MEITLILPDHLFPESPLLSKSRPVYLVEEDLCFRQYSFHKQKLVLHRASMKTFTKEQTQRGFDVRYFESAPYNADIRKLIPQWAEEGIRVIHHHRLSDDWLDRRLTRAAEESGIKLISYRSPGFLNDSDQAAELLGPKRPYFQTDFYIRQRKQRSVLLLENQKPLGGKWSFDQENRRRFPAGEFIPEMPRAKETPAVAEARVYVEKHFPTNWGLSDGPHLFATSHEESLEWLDRFLRERLEKFGDYEDAIVHRQTVLYHSVLSPMINIGLLSPQEVLDRVLDYAQQGTAINSLEGFVRQVMGWREFIHLVYHQSGRQQRTTNCWGFNRPIPDSFRKGETGIAPIDLTLQKLIRTGYCHHIERLMVLGNFFLLCEFNPDEVYRWFMEFFIDSYDWVMVPNVYGMTQFADGGLMTTKPYISGSNYLSKMSDYPKGPWQATWDGLFWRYMHVHREFFLSNPRLGMLVHTFDKMDPSKKKIHLDNAEEFLKSLN